MCFKAGGRNATAFSSPHASGREKGLERNPIMEMSRGEGAFPASKEKRYAALAALPIGTFLTCASTALITAFASGKFFFSACQCS